MCYTVFALTRLSGGMVGTALTQLGFPDVESETQAAVPEFGATCFQLLIDPLDCAEDGSPV